MQVLRLLAARRPARAVSTITMEAPSPSLGRDTEDEDEDDEGPFFDLDFSSSARRASGSASSGSSDSEDDDDASTGELDFIISLQRSRSASPSYESLFFGGAAPLKFCASEPPPSEPRHCGRKRGGVGLRALSFGARKAAFYGAPRHSFARSSGSARSLRLFLESPAAAHNDQDHEAAVDHQLRRAAPSGDVIRRYLTKISSRFRGRSAAVDARGLRHLRKSRSASAAVVAPPSSAAPSRRDDSLAEKQDGIASAIAHCKESLYRASILDCDSPLLRSRSDPGKCEAEA